jgi:hypothetical protein
MESSPEAREAPEEDLPEEQQPFSFSEDPCLRFLLEKQFADAVPRLHSIIRQQNP